MDRPFFRMREPGMDHHPSQINIAVAGLSQCAGTTFIASSLALFLSDNGNSVTFIECGTPQQKRSLLYDAVSMDQRFCGRTFHDVYRILSEDGSVRGLRNQEEGVNWFLITPEDAKQGVTLTEECRRRLLYSGRDHVTIYDLEWDWLSLCRRELDLLILVADPAPSCLIRAGERLKETISLEQFGQLPVLWVVNRTTEGISRRETARVLHSRDVVWIPEIPLQEFHKDEMHSRFPGRNSGNINILSPLFTKVSHWICE